jgi:hypothetical protein
MEEDDFIVVEGQVKIPISQELFQFHRKEICELVDESFQNLCQDIMVLVTENTGTLN